MRNSAATMGVTHVAFVSQTLARAYRCQAQAQAAGEGGSGDHVAKVPAREQAAGTAADQH
jgi:hypothetical protein